MTRPACWNRRPFKDILMVQDGWTEDGRRIMVPHLDQMSKGCPQTKPPFGEAFIHKWDCEGCRWLPEGKEKPNE